MESNEAQELARTMERAEAAPYLAYPNLPAWTPVVFGAWFAAMLAVLLAADDTWGKVALIPLLVAEFVFFRWYARRHGAMPWPGTGNLPAEIRRLYRQYYAGAVLVVLATALVWWVADDWWAVGALFALSSLGFWVHDRAYRGTVGRVRERLA